MPVEDRVLVQQCLAGDQEAFEELVLRHSRRVFQIVHRFFTDALTIDDIAQEVFVKAYMSLHTYSQQQPFSNWLSAIAYHECYRQLRRQKVHRDRFETGIDPDQINLLQEFSLCSAQNDILSPEQKALLTDLVAKVMQQLSPKEQMLLNLLEVEGLRTEEVAQMWGVSVMSIKVGAFRARRHARKILEAAAKQSQRSSGG
jgi:RNA polymerase sigma-70 factor (ECF subfamily)